MFKKLAIVSALVATMTGCASSPRTHVVSNVNHIPKLTDKQISSQPKKVTRYWHAHLLAPQGYDYKDVCGFRTPERMSQHYQKSVTVHDKIINPIARARGLALNDNKQFLLEEDAYMRENYPEFWRHSGYWNSNTSDGKLSSRFPAHWASRDILFVQDKYVSADGRTMEIDKNLFFYFQRFSNGSLRWKVNTLNQFSNYKINPRLYDRNHMSTNISSRIKGRIPMPPVLHQYVGNNPDRRVDSRNNVPVFETLNWNETSGRQLADHYQRVTGYYPPGAQYLSESPNAAPHHTGMVNIVSGGAAETSAVFSTPREYYRCPAEFVLQMGAVMKDSDSREVGNQRAESLMNCLMGKGSCMVTVDTRQVR